MAFFWLLVLGLAKISEAGVTGNGQRNGHGGHELARESLAHDPSRSTSVAICRLVPSAGNAVSGDIVFKQENGDESVEITGMISGLTPGHHGFHVHQNSDISDNCKAAGPHFNPDQATHGAPTDSVRHAGDLGNIPADSSGFSIFQIVDKRISLCENHPRQILGRSIVVHAKEDDLGLGGNEESKKTGNAGARVACCVIEPVSQYY